VLVIVVAVEEAAVVAVTVVDGLTPVAFADIPVVVVETPVDSGLPFAAVVVVDNVRAENGFARKLQDVRVALLAMALLLADVQKLC
jgi:hypothetical protein